MGKLADFFKSVAGICETHELDTGLWRLEGNKARIQIDRVPAFRDREGAVYLKGGGLKYPVLIVKTGDNGYSAYRNRCTHIGHRKLDPVPGESKLRCCSVNHSTYDLNGVRLSGPAKGNLTVHSVDIENGELIVTL